jgi:dipeptidyl aminopeptidase/acylaminoacyl peptidase
VCGAALSAVSNLVAWLDSFPRHWAPFAELMVEAVGHPVRDRALLESISPCFNAARIRAPVLLAHGDGDARVGPEQTGAMAAALSRAGRSVRTLALAGEGHDLLGESSVLVFYRALERFLCEHLGALGSAA